MPSTRRAASRARASGLSLTQPAISHALGRLRELFDDPLFMRQGKAMIPTPLARVMIDPVRESLQGFEATLQRVDRFDPATARKHFTVGMRDVRELTVLPNLLRTVTRAAPFIDIAVVRAERKQLEAELAAGTLDAAIDVHLALSDQVRRQLVNAERLVVVARPRHPAVKRELDLETYLSQEHILVSSRRRGFECRGLRVEPARLEAADSPALPALLRGVPRGERDRSAS